jgi:hypothetical protein
MTTVSTEPAAATTDRTGSKPTYLGLLNEIAEAERRGLEYLTAWADRCSDSEVEEAVRTVAVREGEHCASFTRRVVELGFRLRPRPSTDDEIRRLEVARSDLDDLATFEALGYGDPTPADGPDVFDDYFKDHSIDPVTGALLGRFVAEERESARILRQAGDDLVRRSGVAGGPGRS